jgi:hypothetical protein
MRSPDDDAEQAMEGVEEPQRVIDEDSPDEDDRRAMQYLRAPKQRTSNHVSGES